MQIEENERGETKREEKFQTNEKQKKTDESKCRWNATFFFLRRWVRHQTSTYWFLLGAKLIQLNSS